MMSKCTLRFYRCESPNYAIICLADPKYVSCVSDPNELQFSFDPFFFPSHGMFHFTPSIFSVNAGIVDQLGRVLSCGVCLRYGAHVEPPNECGSRGRQGSW